MQLTIEVKRHRQSVTQGEAEVIVNGKSIVRYGDNIVLNGEYNSFGGWGSNKHDNVFIKAALRQYADQIVK
jgi:uncharacterized Zn-binding protein involved in type VI secretion